MTSKRETYPNRNSSNTQNLATGMNEHFGESNLINLQKCAERSTYMILYLDMLYNKHFDDQNSLNDDFDSYDEKRR